MDFPVLLRRINGKKLVYLDNAATSQKPKQVIDAISDFYKKHNANVHRGLHTLSEESTELYETSRKKVADFIYSGDPTEIIFNSGTTFGLNFLASTLEPFVNEGDEILITVAEHHSNLIPWQKLAQKKNAKLVFVEPQADCTLTPNDFAQKISQKTKIIAMYHVSNVTGHILDVKKVVELAKKIGAITVIDGAQAVPHQKVNVKSIDCDFYTFSGHKMLGSTGIGVLYGKKEWLAKLDPYQTGGGMIDEVTSQTATWAEVPEKFEAGTPNIEGAIGLAAAIDYLTNIGMDKIRSHEEGLVDYALAKLSVIKDISIVGPLNAQHRGGLISFYFDNIHAHDIAAVLNSQGIAVRSGHHCTMPLHSHLKIPATVRASFYLYNTQKDVDKLVKAIKLAKKILG